MKKLMLLLTGIFFISLASALYTGPDTYTNIYAYYNLDETSGQAKDYTGLYNSTYNNPKFGDPGALLNAFTYNGAATVWTNISSTPIVLTNRNFTVSAWFNVSAQATSTTGYIVDLGYYNNNGSALSFNYNTNEVCFYTLFNALAGSDKHVCKTVTDKAGFHNVIGTYIGDDRNQIKLYYDGQNIANTTYNYPDMYLKIVGIGYPGSGATTYFNGSIDEVAVYSRVLSDTEIAALYDNLVNPFSVSVSSIYPTGTFYDTDYKTFKIDVTLNSTFLTAVSPSFYYDGIFYPASTTDTGNNRTYSSSISIPAVHNDTNKTYYWRFDISNGQISDTVTSVNTTIFVKNTSWYYCNQSDYVNFTFHDEENNNLINTEFATTFKWHMNTSSTVFKNVSVNLVGNDNFAFCGNENTTYYVDSSIYLQSWPDDTTHFARNYYLKDKPYTNISTLQPLYMLKDDFASNIIVEIKDQGLNPLVGYLIEIYRQPKAAGEPVLVESDLSDNFGQISASLEQDNTKYTFKFYDTDGNLVRTAEDVVVACRTTICVLSFTLQETLDIFGRFENGTNYDTQLSLLNNRTFQFAWTDASSDSGLKYRLEVTKFSANGTGIVYNGTSTNTFGTLFYNITDDGSYVAQAYRRANGVEIRVGYLTAKVGGAADVFGIEGLFWAFILLFTLVAVGAFSPVIGILLYLVGFLALGLSGIIEFSYPIMIAQIVIGALFIWALRQ